MLKKNFGLGQCLIAFLEESIFIAFDYVEIYMAEPYYHDDIFGQRSMHI